MPELLAPLHYRKSSSAALIARKAASLVKPVVDMEGIEDVDLGGEGPENETQATDNATEEKRSKE